MPTRRDTVVDLYARFSPADARAFVADLYEARGWEADIDGEGISVRRDGHERRIRLETFAADGERPDADATLDAETVAEMLRYAVDHEQRQALLQDHFGRSSLPPTDSDTKPSLRAGIPVRFGALSPGDWASSAGVVALVVLLAGTLGVLGSSLTVGSSASMGASGESTVAPTAGPAEAVQFGANQSGFPPGLSETGVTDRAALVDAHDQLLDNASYTWTLAYQVLDGANIRGVYRGTVAVGSDSVYAVHIERAGNVSGVGLRVGERAYADGVTEWYSKNGTRCTRPIQGATQYDERASRYVEHLLWANESLLADRSLQGGSARYTVELRGGSWSNFEQTTGYVRVNERGRILALHRIAERRSDGATVVVSLRFTDVGETPVSPPTWIAETEAVPGGCYSRS